MLARQTVYKVNCLQGLSIYFSIFSPSGTPAYGLVLPIWWIFSPQLNFLGTPFQTNLKVFLINALVIYLFIFTVCMHMYTHAYVLVHRIRGKPTGVILSSIWTPRIELKSQGLAANTSAK